MKKIKIPLALLLIVFPYIRTFTWLINSWLTDPQYSHGFLIPVISGVIAWMNIRKQKTEVEFEPEEPFKPGIFIFAVGLILYAARFINASHS